MIEKADPLRQWNLRASESAEEFDDRYITVDDAARELGCSRKLAEKIAIRHGLLSGVITSGNHGAEFLVFGPAISAIVSGNYDIEEYKPGVARRGKGRKT